jgi:hypothetical protein
MYQLFKGQFVVCVTEWIKIIQHVKTIVLYVCILISVLELVSDVLETQSDEDYNTVALIKQYVPAVKTECYCFDSKVDRYKLSGCLQNESTENLALDEYIFYFTYLSVNNT